MHMALNVARCMMWCNQLPRHVTKTIWTLNVTLYVRNCWDVHLTNISFPICPAQPTVGDARTSTNVYRSQNHA
jgi:hypothetical protein